MCNCAFVTCVIVYVDEVVILALKSPGPTIKLWKSEILRELIKIRSTIRNKKISTKPINKFDTKLYSENQDQHRFFY